jgi:hypothetical protein
MRLGMEGKPFEDEELKRGSGGKHVLDYSLGK